MAKKKSRPDVYQIVTERVLNIMDTGVLPWQMPWNNVQANLRRKNEYNGINIMMLDAIQYIEEYSTPWWCTYKQAKEMGGQPRKGEKTSIIVFWFNFEKKDEDGDPTGEWWGTYRYYNVFNADQIDWPDDFELPDQIDGGFDEIIEAEDVITKYMEREEIAFHEGGNEASHSVLGNSTISMPVKDQFRSEELYYKTFFHEMVHSTRHSDRLNREKSGSESGYSMEELVAEMGAAILCNILGFTAEMEHESAAYIQGWAQAFKDDKKMVMQASSKAKRAVKYILGEKLD